MAQQDFVTSSAILLTIEFSSISRNIRKALHQKLGLKINVWVLPHHWRNADQVHANSSASSSIKDFF